MDQKSSLMRYIIEGFQDLNVGGKQNREVEKEGLKKKFFSYYYKTEVGLVIGA